MLFKLAFNNIKKSIKDYSIYFFTLVIAVSIFYVFNSLDAQKAMFKLNESKYEIINSLTLILSYISVFISVVLGFLIIYSNKFLIKKRKKEFGLYLTLGMSKRKVSTILVLETLIVGLISLGVGLILGIFASQFLSIITAKLFEVDMTSFKFVFSSGALFKTLLYFGLIFILVMIFNVITISRTRLINLLTAVNKNEKVRFRNKYVTAIAFILSIGLLYYAYHLLFDGALLSFDNDLATMLIAGSVGTLLLFFSISGFFLKIFEHIKKIYFKNLNMFTLKQVNNKFNTTVLSTTIICLMLLLTIGILSGSISLINVYNTDAKNTNVTDFTIESYESNCVVVNENECVFEKTDTNLKKEVSEEYFVKYVKEYVYYDLYGSDNVSMIDIVDEKTKNDLYKQYGGNLEFNTYVPIISETDYNKILDLYNRSNEKINLNEKEYLLTVGLLKAEEIYNSFYKEKGTIKINDNILKPATDEMPYINIKNFASESNFGLIVVNDSIINNLELKNSAVIGNYYDTSNLDAKEKDIWKNITDRHLSMSLYTKNDMQTTNIGVKVMSIFVGLYVGIIFAISSATILAIGQLSESSDNKERFKILRKIGTDDKMANRALFNQIAYAFILPLVVALFHAYFGLRELNGIIEVIGDIDLSSNILITALFIVIIYGGYFIATYIGSKNMIKGKE